MTRSLIRFACGALALLWLWMGFGPKVVRGRVVDSATGGGIKDVTVRALQRGWGRSAGYTVWDKTYDYSAITDEDGRFVLKYYRGGASVHLQFSKQGYRATKAGYPLQDTYVDFWESPQVQLAPNKN